MKVNTSPERCAWSIKIYFRSSSCGSGWDFTAEEALQVGERLVHLERIFNMKHGLTVEDDVCVPPRVVEAPPSGRAAGKPMAPYVEWMVKETYRLLG